MKLSDGLTVIVPFYRNVGMLGAQLAAMARWPSAIRVIVVDDGSPEAAEPIIRREASPDLLDRLELYRIDVDIEWNRGGARNLGTKQAQTDWIVHVDIDHVLPPASAVALLQSEVYPDLWYRFRRFRRGRADETRRKDTIPPDHEFGEIKPHIDSYLITRDLYWQAGGYNEDFSGCLGGGTPFLGQLSRLAPASLLPDDVSLEVYTRDVIADASDHTLSRDTTEFTRRKQRMGGDYRGSNPIRFPWTRLL